MGFFLLLPFFLVRFGLLFLLNREAVKRAAAFAPLLGGEKTAYWIYQASNAAILISLFFLKIKTQPLWLFWAGAAVYGAGTLLLTASVASFAAPMENGMNRSGVYRVSRNPMYVAYFLYFTGCALLAQSLVLFGMVLIFQTAAHWIIRSEEWWCLETFGDSYRQYMERVRRYL